MEQMFEWGGEQMALYLGKEMGDLLIVTLNKCAGIYLLTSCILMILIVLSKPLWQSFS